MEFFRGKLSYKEVANRYGVAIGTVQQWVRKGWIKRHKLAGRTYFTEEDLKEFERRAEL